MSNTVHFFPSEYDRKASKRRLQEQDIAQEVIPGIDPDKQLFENKEISPS
jgi:hypothetical protein